MNTIKLLPILAPILVQLYRRVAKQKQFPHRQWPRAKQHLINLPCQNGVLQPKMYSINKRAACQKRTAANWYCICCNWSIRLTLFEILEQFRGMYRNQTSVCACGIIHSYSNPLHANFKYYGDSKIMRMHTLIFDCYIHTLKLVLIIISKMRRIATNSATFVVKVTLKTPYM